MMISVVVPAFNETDRIVPSLERILSYLQQRHPDFEILVVDDGSTDATAATVRERFAGQPRVNVLSYGINRGKGYAVRHGMAHAEGELVLFSDADLSTPIEEIERMLPLIDDGYDVVIGSRAHAEADIRERQPLYRELGGKLFNLMVRIAVMPELHDTQCGFKLFRRSRLAPILPNLRIDGFAFDVEILALARAAGLRIVEVPVVWINSLASRVRMSAALRAYLDLLGIRLRARRLRAAVAGGRRAETAPPAH
jgi:dolichyl-phosphate beta-glucosyltransferase